jgi:hypothetical protein
MHLPKVQNKSQLERLLTIDSLKKESIYSMIGRMEVLLDFLDANPEYAPLTPFLKTYYFVTRASATKFLLYKHYFSSLRDYEALDVYFASLYFTPMLRFLMTGNTDAPWKTYFEYCMSGEDNHFLQIMLGINAHINSDLYKALVYLPYDHHNDFLLVNRILKEVSPSVIDLLAKDYDLIGIGGLYFKHFIEEEFKTTILKWRLKAWSNAHPPIPYHHGDIMNTVNTHTEQIGQTLIENFNNVYHLKKLPSSIKAINSAEIDLIKIFLQH